MSDQIENRHKSSVAELLYSWTAGLILTGILFALGQKGYLTSMNQALLWPGLAISSLLGYGTHDLPLYSLTLVFDSLIYGAVAYGLLVLIRVARS